MISTYLLYSEVWYTVTHFMVLCTSMNIVPSPNSRKTKPYFVGDMISALSSCAYTGKNKWLSFVHFCTHVPAVFHLFGWKTVFYKNVFHLARGEKIPIRNAHRILYVVGTMADILCHFVHIQNLRNIEQVKN